MTLQEALKLSNPYFDDDARRVAKMETGSPKSRSTIIILKPSQFLEMAAPGTSSRKTETVQTLLKEDRGFDTLPYLMFKNNGDGTAKISGHEGRHRCRELQKLGDKPIPVVFVSVEGGQGPAIRWSSQDDAFDRVDRWPHELISEEGDKRMAFPESAIYPHDKTKIESKDKVLKSWVSRDKLTELHLVKDEYGYIIQDIRKSVIDKKAPGVKGQSFLNKIRSDGEAIKEFERRVKEITTPKGLSIKKRKVAPIMSKIADTESVDAKLEVFAKRTKPNKRLKRAVKNKKSHKQISRQLKTHGKKLIEMEKKLLAKRAEIDKELKKLQGHKERHRKRIVSHIDRMGVGRQRAKAK